MIIPSEILSSRVEQFNSIMEIAPANVILTGKFVEFAGLIFDLYLNRL
jgi:hypothetical protein